MGPGDLKTILSRAAAALPAAGATPLLVGLETGDDAGVYPLDAERALVVTTDFITPVCDDPFLYGQVAAANALSDVFAMGGAPLVALALCCFPEELDPELAAAICAGGEAKVREAGAVIGGGHSVRNPELMYGLAITGQVHPARIVRNVGARAGAALVLTKPLGTGVVINGARRGDLAEPALLAACRTMAELNAAAAALMVAHGAQAATDVTGFGLAGHALGMARGSGVRFRIELGRLPLYAEAERLVDAGVSTRGTRQNREAFAAQVHLAAPEGARARLVYDPQTAGGLLIAIDADAAAPFVDELRGRGVAAAAVIGEVLPAAPGDLPIELA